MNPLILKHFVRRNLIICILHRRRKRQQRIRQMYMRTLFLKRLPLGTRGEYGLFSDLENDPMYFHKYFRMPKECLEEIFTFVRQDIEHPQTHMRPISAKIRLAMTIRFLATGTSQVSLGMQYRISQPSVSNILRETMSAILKHMKSVYLPQPKNENWVRSEKVFREKWNFPFCVGAVDGKHVRIKAPWKSGSLNFNYKGFFSVVVLAVVSGDYKFLAVDVGAPGSESDAGVFSRSAFMRLVEKKKLQIPTDGILGQREVPHVIVGDEAFPLKPWLMRPYPGSDLNLKKSIYNYRLSRARRVVENTFGIWASKWRILFTPIDGDDDLVSMIIWTTLVLHNFLQEKLPGNIEGEVDEVSLGRPGLQNIPRVATNNYSVAAADVREVFAEYFASDVGSVPWQLEYVTRSL